MKKNNFLLVLLGIFFLFISISAVSAWEYDNSYTYGKATAYAKVVGNYPQCDGQKYNNYCVGDYYVDVSFTGDKFYMGYSYTSWSPTSNSDGYSGIPSSTPGKKILPTENGHPKGYIICGWDYQETSYNKKVGNSTEKYTDWAWTSICGGYLVKTFDELKVVECYQDSDCSNGFCQKTGITNDQDWKCVQRICTDGDERCFGSNTQRCEGNQWVDKGVIMGKCSAECTTDLDCPEDSISDTFCSGNNILQTNTDNRCSNYQCISSSQDAIIQSCAYQCQDVTGEGAICIEKVCDAGEKMCSPDGNILNCYQNGWLLDQDCSYGCDNGKCKSFYTTKLFFGIVIGTALFFILLLVILIVLVAKRGGRGK